MNADKLRQEIEKIKADIKATPDEEEDRLHFMWLKMKRLKKQLEGLCTTQ